MSKRKNYITILSIISAFAVVFLHANACFWSFNKGRNWLTANIIECIFYFAVPVFFMITGANLIDYQDRYSTKEYFKKRIKKVLIPFIVWSIIGLLYQLQKGDLSIHSIDIKYIFNGLVTGSIVKIYWFFPILICAYLCIPLFASVEKNKRKTIFSYLTIVGFIINSLVPFIINVFKLDLSIPVPIFVCMDCLLYVIIGYLLDNYDIRFKNRIIIYILGIAGLLIHIIGTYKLSYNAGTIIETFKGYYNVPCVLYSVGIFVLAKNIFKDIKSNRIIDFISKHTLSIYLMHIFIIDIIIRIFELNTYSIVYRLGVPFVVIPICILISFVLKKIPVLKNIVP